MTMTPDQAAIELRKGAKLSVEVDVAEQALALSVPHLLRHISPTATNGRIALDKFRMLADNAGLPHDHPSFAGWLAIRALRVDAGDAVVCTTGCEITRALLASLGAAPVAPGQAIRADRNDHQAVSITDDLPQPGELGVFATPAGTIRIPADSPQSLDATWNGALAAADAAAAALGRRPYDSDPDAIIELDWLRPDRSGSVDADSIHEDWSPEIAWHPDLKAHPSKLIQSATLATVSPPEARYRPRLTRRVIQSGRISNAQFEFIVAAGEAHGRHLPVDPDFAQEERRKRVGIYLADGTGAGKTNEMLGVVLDNLLRGRRKAILVLAKRRHLPGFVEAWAGMGRDRRDFICQWDYKVDQDIRATRGILVTTYSQLRDLDEESPTPRFLRVEQIQRWAGDDFEGPLLFDEAQEMRNAAGEEDKSGKSSDNSVQGLAGIALQDSLPEARVVYGSATGATDVHNMAYATRLGLWGWGTCFATRASFISTFEQGGIADLEQVTLSLKASGVYVARSLSFDGVEVRHLPVTLTAEERRTYNDASKLWTDLHSAFKQAGELCGVPIGDKERISSLRENGLRGVVPYSSLNGVFEANRKISMSTLISAFKARGVITDAKEQIEAGHAVVVQMQNTYEAQLERALARLEDTDDIRLEPAELISFAENIPVHRYKIVEEPNPKPNPPKGMEKIQVYRPVLDAEGNHVTDQRAVELRNIMIARARSLRLPLPPLDQILIAFGPARVAEVTGRSRRLVPDRPNGDRDGSTKVVLEERCEDDRRTDIQLFHDGKKPVLIFSTGAGGSSLSYHAKIGTKAGSARRMHYLVQLGYRADEVTQGIGRTHRSDQTMPPVVSLVTIDLPADRLYASRIVSALFKLGALTQGHRHATSNGMFDERDCLDGPYAKGAWDDLKEDIQKGLIPNYTWDQFMADMCLDHDGNATKMVWGKEKVETGVLTNINKMINRVAALTDRRQDIIFEHLRNRIDARIEKAIAEGTFNAGPETLKATSLTIVSDRRVPTDRVHGGSTRMLRIRRRSEIAHTGFKDAFRRYMQAKRSSGYANFCTHRTTGAVALIAPGKPVLTMLGEKIATKEVITPTGSTTRFARIVDREPWIPAVDMDKIESMWNATVEAAPTETTSYVTIVADALLPVWNVLNIASGSRTAVYRMQTDDGTPIVGRQIDDRQYALFCKELGLSARPEQSEVDEIVAALEAGGKVALAARSKDPHMLVGKWSGGRMCGASIELSEGVGPDVLAILDALPSAGTQRRPGDVCDIASRRKDLEHAIATIASICPPLHVEDAGAAANVAGTGTAPAVASVATQSFAAVA